MKAFLRTAIGLFLIVGSLSWAADPLSLEWVTDDKGDTSPKVVVGEKSYQVLIADDGSAYYVADDGVKREPPFNLLAEIYNKRKQERASGQKLSAPRQNFLNNWRYVQAIDRKSNQGYFTLEGGNYYQVSNGRKTKIVFTKEGRLVTEECVPVSGRCERVQRALEPKVQKDLTEFGAKSKHQAWAAILDNPDNQAELAWRNPKPPTNVIPAPAVPAPAPVPQPQVAETTPSHNSSPVRPEVKPEPQPEIAQDDSASRKPETNTRPEAPPTTKKRREQEPQPEWVNQLRPQDRGRYTQAARNNPHKMDYSELEGLPESYIADRRELDRLTVELVRGMEAGMPDAVSNQLMKDSVKVADRINAFWAEHLHTHPEKDLPEKHKKRLTDDLADFKNISIGYRFSEKLLAAMSRNAEEYYRTHTVKPLIEHTPQGTRLNLWEHIPDPTRAEEIVMMRTSIDEFLATIKDVQDKDKAVGQRLIRFTANRFSQIKSTEYPELKGYVTNKIVGMIDFSAELGGFNFFRSESGK